MAGGYPFFCHLSRLIQSCAARAPFIFWSYAVIIGQTFNPLGLGLIYSIFSYFNVFNGFLTAVQVVLLTIDDVCKAVDRGMMMCDEKLLEKSGGKSSTWVAAK